MSAAQVHDIRLRVGTKVALLGALLVLATWLSGALAWKRETARALAADEESRAREVQARVALQFEQLMQEAPAAVALAAERARTKYQGLSELRGEHKALRRLIAEPDPALLLQAELEAADLMAAWIKDSKGRVFWTEHCLPVRERPSGLAPSCACLPPGPAVLARCSEVPLAAQLSLESELIAGGAESADLSGIPGAWAIHVDDGVGPPLAASPDWLPFTMPAELATGTSGGQVLVVGGQRQRFEARLFSDRGVVLVTAVAASPPLDWAELVRGRAGSRTAEWRDHLMVTGGVAALALAFLLALAMSINAAFEPVVRAAHQLDGGQLDVTVPVRRSDEIGHLAAVLNELGASVKAARQGWEREARLAAWRDVARGLAHEIKNPLMPIRGTVENLQRWRVEQPERFDENFDSRMSTILEEVDQLSRLASAFADFARLPSPVLADVDVPALMREVASLQLGDVDGVTVVDELHDVGLTRADSGHLRQVFTNLLKNAREALASGGGEITLRDGRTESGTWFAVSDNGPGVSSDLREQLFDPGWSTRRQEGGSGLGLWLCRRIALEHGGSIDAGESPGGGLTVTLSLPDSPRAFAATE